MGFVNQMRYSLLIATGLGAMREEMQLHVIINAAPVIVVQDFMWMFN